MSLTSSFSVPDFLRTWWWDQVAPRLPDSLQVPLSGDPHRHLLDSVDHGLLLHDRTLINLQSGETVTLSEAGISDPQEWAQAAKTLVKTEGPEKALQLFLPPTEFIATTFQLPGVSRDNVLSALQLQTEALFPACEESLAVAARTQRDDQSGSGIALWLPRARLDNIFAAFESAGMFLVAVQPRLLLCRSDGSVIDKDLYGATLAQFEQGVIAQWARIDAQDLDDSADPALQEEWDQLLEAETGTALQKSSASDYVEDAEDTEASDYCFFPSGALAAGRRAERGRTFVMAGIALAVLLVIAALPFAWQAIQFRSLAADLEEYRQLSADARADRAVVVDFEGSWGAISDFPDMELRNALFTLQNILLPDRLSSLEVSEGLISIQGTSSEPQAILQRLEQDPLFTEVVFSRATNNSRYYIDLRISTVNFEAYMVRYFPDE